MRNELLLETFRGTSVQIIIGLIRNSTDDGMNAAREAVRIDHREIARLRGVFGAMYCPE